MKKKVVTLLLAGLASGVLYGFFYYLLTHSIDLQGSLFFAIGMAAFNTIFWDRSFLNDDRKKK